MPMYTFYACQPDGSSLGFEAYELADDGAALTKAMLVLEQHTGCAYVVAWCGNRKVLARHRVDPDLMAVLVSPRDESVSSEEPES